MLDAACLLPLVKNQPKWIFTHWLTARSRDRKFCMIQT